MDWVYRRPADRQPIRRSILFTGEGDFSLSTALFAVFNVTANLSESGKMSAVLPIEFDVAAELNAFGALAGVLPIEFGLAASIQDKPSLEAGLGIEFNVLAALMDATPVVSEEVHPPGTSRRKIMETILEDDDLILAVIMAFLHIRGDRWH